MPEWQALTSALRCRLGFDPTLSDGSNPDFHISAKRRTLERQLSDVLAATSSCDLTRALQAKISRARDQLLTFLDHPGRVEAARVVTCPERAKTACSHSCKRQGTGSSLTSTA